MKKKKPQTIEIGGITFNPGRKVNYDEFEDIAVRTGRPVSELKTTLEGGGFRIDKKGLKYYYEANDNTKPSEPLKDQTGTAPGVGSTGISVTDAQFPWDKYATLQKELGAIQSGAVTESERIRGASNEEIAKISSAASQFGDTSRLTGTQYAVDSEERWRSAVATIEGDKKASLQNIINAGLKDVAEIEGAYSLKNVQAKGGYDLQMMGLRTKADTDIGRMDSTSKLYGLMGLAFG
jgi:hypothetical protein